MNSEKILSHIPLVQKMALFVWNRTCLSVELDDLIFAGTLGLLEADESFDPEKNVPHEACLSKRIRWAILDELRRHGPIPYHQYRKMQPVHFSENVNGITAIPPNNHELTDFMTERLEEDERPVLDALASRRCVSCRIRRII